MGSLTAGDWCGHCIANRYRNRIKHIGENYDYQFFFATQPTAIGQIGITMKAEINIIQRVSDALDEPVEKVLKNKTACDQMAKLFETSPLSGRGKPRMIRARVSLIGNLAETLHRGEIQKLIEGNPEFASELLEQLKEVQKAVECTVLECKKAIQSGGSKRLE